MHEFLCVCVCVSVYTCVKCKQNGCHSLCCCCCLPDGCDAENAVANTKRAKNASKLLESWKIEFCVPPGRTLRTAHTHTHTHRVFCVFVLVFLAYYTRLLQMHIVNPFGHKGKHRHTRAPIDTHRWHTSSSRNMSVSVSVNIRWVVLAHYHRLK